MAEVRTTIDSRLALSLLLLAVLALGAFVAVGFRPLSSRALKVPDPQRAAAVAVAGTEFVNVNEEWGLASNRHDTVGKAGAGVTSIADAIAPGVGLLDLDGDTDLDLVQLNGPAARVGLTFWINQRKESGQTRFLNKTEELGVHWSGAAQGICAGDVDNDGDVDLFVSTDGPNLLLLNQFVMNGKRTEVLRFDDVSEKAGIRGERWHWIRNAGGQAIAVRGAPTREEGADKEVPEFSAGATFGDFDGDGDLDLYVANYVAAFEARWAQESIAEQADRPEKIQFQPKTFDGMPDRFYVNETGAGGVVRFREVTAEAGVNDQQGRGLTATFMRVEEKIYPDIYVVTDAGTNLFLHNVGAATEGEAAAIAPANDGGNAPLRRRFEDATSEFGLADRRSGMGLARGDADADGDLDLLTTNWRNPASLFLYREEPHMNLETKSETTACFFEERGVRARLAEETAPLIGWGCVFFDYDDDGDEDLFIGNGATSPRDDQPDRCGPERVLLFKNRGDGIFDNVTASAGAALQLPYGARGVVTGDIDRDGDLDLVIAQNNGPLVVLENRRPANGNQSLTIAPKSRLRGDAANFEVVVNVGQQRLVRELLSGSSYLSQEPFEAHFGLGRAKRADRVQVTWPWLEAPPPTVRVTVDAGLFELEQGKE
jgi:enediyne biosynthesis protein E4